MKSGADNYFIGSGSPKILKDYLYQIGTICGKSELIKIGLMTVEDKVFLQKCLIIPN